MTRLAITGAAGRMGRTLAQAIAAQDSVELTAAFERDGAAEIGSDAGAIAGIGNLGVSISNDIEKACGQFDVLIDFTIADATEKHIEICRAAGKKLIVGTTGLSESQRAALYAAGEDIAIVFAPNYSVGVNVAFKLAATAAGILGDDYDVEIIEAHHRFKVDAPSGTALGLGEAVAGALGRDLAKVARHGREGITGERDDKTIGFHAIRGGDIVGEHTVVFAGMGERIELTHRSQSRMNFAVGAVRAASWIADYDRGVFTMQDVLGLS